MNQAKTRRCPACRQAELQPATRVREFHPRGRAAPVRVELLTSVCPSCGAEATSAAQHSENLKRLKARKAQYGGLLLGEEIFSLRRRYGITQQAAARIFEPLGLVPDVQPLGYPCVVGACLALAVSAQPYTASVNSLPTGWSAGLTLSRLAAAHHHQVLATWQQLSPLRLPKNTR